MSLASLSEWLPDGPDFIRRDASGTEVARVWEQVPGWWLFRTQDHEGQSGDTLCGAQIRATVALCSERRPLQR
jgi:hypothetical protein